MITCISVGGILIQDGRVLLCHPSGNPSGKWSLPKGQAKPDESYLEVAYREVLEETGYSCFVRERVPVDIEPYKAYYVDEETQIKSPAMKTLVFFIMDPIEKIQEPDWECDYFLWIKEKDLPIFSNERELPVILKALEMTKHVKG